MFFFFEKKIIIIIYPGFHDVQHLLEGTRAVSARVGSFPCCAAYEGKSLYTNNRKLNISFPKDYEFRVNFP